MFLFSSSFSYFFSLGNAFSPLLSPYSSQPPPQLKPSDKLKKWIKEYDGGVKNHGEPNTWDVTLVTDMSNLFKRMSNFNAP